MFEASAAMARRTRRRTRKQTQTQDKNTSTQTNNKRSTKDKHNKKGILERMGTGSRADLGERPGLESYMYEAVGWGWGLQPT